MKQRIHGSTSEIKLLTHRFDFSIRDFFLLKTEAHSWTFLWWGRREDSFKIGLSLAVYVIDSGYLHSPGRQTHCVKLVIMNCSFLHWVKVWLPIPAFTVFATPCTCWSFINLYTFTSAPFPLSWCLMSSILEELSRYEFTQVSHMSWRWEMREFPVVISILWFYACLSRERSQPIIKWFPFFKKLN